jgi:hypothetical protein
LKKRYPIDKFAMVPALEERKRHLIEKMDIGNRLEDVKDKEWGKYLQ